MIIDSKIRPASSNDSRKAAAKRGCKVLSTGSSGRIKSLGNFSQVIWDGVDAYLARVAIILVGV
jgi:hypothetical protein